MHQSFLEHFVSDNFYQGSWRSLWIVLSLHEYIVEIQNTLLTERPLLISFLQSRGSVFKRFWLMNLKEKVLFSPQVRCCFKERSSEEAPGLCALLLASLMTQCLCDFFYQKPEREKELKCSLLKTLMHSFRAADSVLSDNQDKTARVSSLLRLFPLSIPIPGSCGIPREGQ